MPLTPPQRRSIVALRDSGLNVSRIADRVGVTWSTVYTWLRRYEQEGNVERHPPLPRRRVTTAEQDAAILAAHSADPLASTRVTARRFHVSAETVRRRLNQNSMKPLPAKKRARQWECRMSGFAQRYYFLGHTFLVCRERFLGPNKDKT